MSYPPAYTYPQPQPPVEVKVPRRGLAITAMVLGIVGVIFGLIPLFALIALALGILAFVFGILGRKHGMGKAGVILGIISTGLGVIGFVILANTFNDVDKAVNEMNTSFTEYSACIDKATTPEQMAAC